MSEIDWRTVAVGDVVKAPSGALRVVRDVHRYVNTRSHYAYNPARRTMLCFTIGHCSWTGRCYTVYSVGELNGMGYTATGIRVKFKTRIDQEVTAYIQEGSKPYDGRPYEFDCCDVRGIR